MKPVSPAPRLTVEYLPIGSIQPDQTNARLHKPPQIAAIARSIATFGFNVPVLVDDAGKLIAGHGRLAGAAKAGLHEVPVIRLGHLTEHQRRAYMIADNRLTDLSRWDERILGETLRDLSLADLDFELDVIGFSVGEIDLRIDGLSETPEPDEAPILIEADSITAPGQLWHLGKHRLLCGDALDLACWDRLMQSEKAAIGFSDPPYNLPVQGFISGLGRVQHREFGMAAGEMDSEQFEAFLEESFRHMSRHSLAGSLHFIAMDWRHTSEMLSAGETAFTELKNICVWVKPAGGMGSLYRSRHELFFVWKNGRGRHQNNVELGRFGRSRSNVWEYASAAAFRYSEGTDLLAAHPTCKPVPLVADAILDASRRGEIVIDPFLGSGTTIVAAERVGRACYGMELDPVYCDAMIRRFETLTGEQARREDGTTFTDLENSGCEGAPA